MRPVRRVISRIISKVASISCLERANSNFEFGIRGLGFRV